MRRFIDHSIGLGRIIARSGVAGRFLVFSAVGIVGTIAHYSVLVVLHEFLGVGPVTASAAGFVAGAFVNYLLNYHVTFESDASHGSTITKFYLIATVGFLLNIAVMWLMVRRFDVQYVGSQLVATGVVLAWGFAANSVWTFSKTQQQ